MTARLDKLLGLLLLLNLLYYVYLSGIVSGGAPSELLMAFEGVALYVTVFKLVAWIGLGLAAIVACCSSSRHLRTIVSVYVLFSALIFWVWVTLPNSAEFAQLVEEAQQAASEPAPMDSNTFVVSHVEVHSYPDSWTVVIYGLALLYVWVLRPRISDNSSRDGGARRA